MVKARAYRAALGADSLEVRLHGCLRLHDIMLCGCFDCKCMSNPLDLSHSTALQVVPISQAQARQRSGRAGARVSWCTCSVPAQSSALCSASSTCLAGLRVS